MRMVFRLSVILTIVFGLVNPAPAQPGGSGGINKATLILAVGDVGDGSFIDQIWGSLQKAGTDFGIAVDYHAPDGTTTGEALLEQAAAGDADIIIVAGTMFSEQVVALATANPVKKFICIDFESDLAVPSNLAAVSFREHEGAFLVGMIAALKSGSGRIAFLGATRIPLMERFQAGYTQGALYAKPTVDVESAFVAADESGFADPVKGKQLALGLIDDGADVLFHAAGSSGLGMFEAAEERGVMAIGVDMDQSSLASPGVIITSMLKREDVIVYDLVEKAVNNEFSGGAKSFGLSDDALDYFDSAYLTDDIRQAVLSAKAAIISGELVVQSIPANLTAAQSWGLYE